MNPVLMEYPRHVRRIMLAAEEKRRARGDWGPWERLTFPKGSVGSGWAAGFAEARKNLVFSVLVREFECRLGTVTHLAVSSLSGIRPTWWEMQRIKNEIAGADATAVEVYPPAAEVVDGADMFHIWALPASLPFGLVGSGIRATQEPPCSVAGP